MLHIPIICFEEHYDMIACSSLTRALHVFFTHIDFCIHYIRNCHVVSFKSLYSSWYAVPAITLKVHIHEYKGLDIFRWIRQFYSKIPFIAAFNSIQASLLHWSFWCSAVCRHFSSHLVITCSTIRCCLPWCTRGYIMCERNTWFLSLHLRSVEKGKMNWAVSLPDPCTSFSTVNTTFNGVIIIPSII